MLSERYLKLPEVAAISGLSSPTIKRLEKINRFPARKKIGLRAVSWLSSDIKNWVAATSGKANNIHSGTADKYIED